VDFPNVSSFLSTAIAMQLAIVCLAIERFSGEVLLIVAAVNKRHQNGFNNSFCIEYLSCSSVYKLLTLDGVSLAGGARVTAQNVKFSMDSVSKI
jgi:hypothetical protein